MIVCKKDIEYETAKIVKNFTKIFEDKLKWHLRNSGIIKTQKNGKD
jgi:hypothetical protein